MKHKIAHAVLLGVLLFVLLGVAEGLFTAPIPPENSMAGLILGAAVWFAGYGLVLGLLLAGWLRGFPRWVYPYLGYALIFPLYLSLAATPGLALFSFPLWGRELWGWRAFVPLGLVTLLAVWLSHPPAGNLVRLARNAWDDWTLAAFGLYGLMPMVVFISLDEVAHWFAFWPKLAGTGLILLGALLYMRLARSGPRYLALLVGAFAAVIVMSAGASYYWQTHAVNLLTGVITPATAPVDWLRLLASVATEASLAAGLLLIPVPLGLALARRLYNQSQSVQPNQL